MACAFFITAAILAAGLYRRMPADSRTLIRRTQWPSVVRNGMAWAAGAIALGAGLAWAGEPLRPAPAPPFPTADPAGWIGTPATWESLRGRVVLLDVWTFG
jgi:hypothetical protein